MARIPPRLLSLLFLGTAAFALLVAAVVFWWGPGKTPSGGVPSDHYRVFAAPFAAGTIRGHLVLSSGARAAWAGSVPNGCPPAEPRAVVLLTGVVSGVGAPAGPISLSLGPCGFNPRLAVGQEGRVVEVKAGPDHRIEAWEGEIRVFDAARSGDASFVLPSPGVWKIRCAAGHPGEEAFVYVASHPYATVTGADGAFTLASVPAGHYSATVWAPPDLTASRPVEVVADTVSDLTLSL